MSDSRPGPCLLGLDWGTTQLRAYLIAADGSIVDRREGGPGIMAVEPGGFDAAFHAFAGDWAGERAGDRAGDSGGGTGPILAAGMVGSRQGWLEAPYAPCPAGLDDLAGALATIHTSRGAVIRLVPGLSIEEPGRAPDVMRGEETQVIGALDEPAGDALALLPGTHSKWARVEGGRIVTFTTYMTGEVFALLAEHSILARMMAGREHDTEGFERGVTQGLDAAGGLLGRLFSARTLALFDRIEPAAVHAYLSGVLIGTEVREALAAGARGRVTIIGGAALAARYEQALAIAGVESERAAPEAAARGLARIARAMQALENR